MVKGKLGSKYIKIKVQGGGLWVGEIVGKAILSCESNRELV